MDKLAKLTTANTSSPFSTMENTSSNILGRVTGHKQTTDGTDYATAYTYNLSGALDEETYPSTRKVKNVLDANGDLAMVESKKNSSSGYWSYANSFTYNPAGAVTSMQLGNGKWESTTFNSRLQPTQIALGTTPGALDKLQLDYGYGTTANNGNVQSQTITVKRSGQSDLIFDQTYTYDDLNRLKIAEEKTGTTTNWKQTFTFDRYGNRRFDESNTTFPASFSNGNLTNPTFNTSNNRFASGQNWTYDAAGNVIGDPDGRTFTYDGENKQVEAKNSSSATLGTYYFDGDGKRVKKVVPSTGETTIFVYDAGGKLINEYSTSLSSTPKVQYQTSDNLGTPRINTDADGNIVSRTDYMPYGEEIIGLGGRSSTDKYVADDVRQGFTGYINDGETGLDFAEARMYAKNLGRFNSPDSILIRKDRQVDPQRVNLYVYVRNNPFVFIDISGEDLILANKNARATFTQVSNYGMTSAERKNIRVLANGRVTLRNRNAIDMQNASYAYQQAATLVLNRNLTINVYTVAPGQTILGHSYQDAYTMNGSTDGNAGDRVRNVFIPQGGAAPVLGNPHGSSNRVPSTEDAIFAHEVFGHGMGHDGNAAIDAENSYRRSRTPPLGERSGDDHRAETIVNGGGDYNITTPPTTISTEPIRMRPVEPLPTPPPKKPDEFQ